MRPPASSLTNQPTTIVPMSLQRIAAAAEPGQRIWIGPDDAIPLSKEGSEQYALAHEIMKHLCIEGPLKHNSGHPGGPLSAFTFTFGVHKHRNPAVDQPMRYSAGHLSLLAYGMQYLFGRDGNDERLKSPQAIIDTFRTPRGLPGHVEAGIGDIPFGTGPLGKGVSNALGVAFGLKHLKKDGWVDVLMADGDSQEGQIQEAFRLAAHLGLDNLVVHGDINDIQLSGIPSQTVAADIAAIAHATGWHVIEVQNGNYPTQVKAALMKADTLKGTGKPIFCCYYTTMGFGIDFMEEGSNTGKKNFHGAPLSEEEAATARKELRSLDELTAAYKKFHATEKARAANAVVTDVPLRFDAAGYKKAITADKGAARKDFGAQHIRDLMKLDERIVVLHADLAGSGGFDKVEKEFPTRVINVGVAEANMAMMAAGMRQAGLLPLTYTFAAFGTNEARASARLIDINCGHTRCAVFHDCTHAGLSVGEDGETHQERHYLNVPFDHTQVWMTADSNQAAAMAVKGLELIAEGHTNVYAFFPRDNHAQLKDPHGELIYDADYVFDGKANMLRGTGDIGDDITVIATGIPVHFALEAADRLKADKKSVRVLNVACVRPLDAAAIIQAALETGHIVVAEDHSSEGGLASQVADMLADFNIPCSLTRLGVNNYFPSAPAKDLYVMAGIDTDSIEDAIRDDLNVEVYGGEDAFVSALYEMLQNASRSRFGPSMRSFIDKLINETGYLEELRAYWQKRECPPEQLPKNDDLRRKLGQVREGDVPEL